MISLYSVIYYDYLNSHSYSNKHFYLNQKRAASYFARTVSKKSGKRSQVCLCNGYYDINNNFNEIESSSVSIYENGRRV